MMKQDNIKITAKSVKKAKPSAKGAALKSVKESEKPKATTPRPSLVRRGMGWWFSAAFASIAIIGVIVFFQDAPENARKAWAPAVALAVILTANFSRAIIKLVNPPRATERSCGVFICSLYSYNNG